MTRTEIDFVVFTIYALSIGIWMTRAQDDFLRAYAAATGEPVRTSAELGKTLLRPWELLTKAPLTRASRAWSTRQSDPKLEALRQRYLQRRQIAFVAFFAGFFVLVALRFGR